MKRNDARLSGSTESSDGQRKVMDLNQIRMHPTFVDLLPIDEKLLNHTIHDMREHGYYPSKPIVLAIWKGLDVAVLIDGHMRVRAAREAGIPEVPFVLMEFESEVEALQHAVCLQAKRRSTTDGAIYRLCKRYDRLLERGGDRRSEEAKSSAACGAVEKGLLKSAQQTAQAIGCNFRKIEKAMANGEDSSLALVKPLKITFSRENVAFLQELGGDVGDHVNKAIEMYIRWLRERVFDNRWCILFRIWLVQIPSLGDDFMTETILSQLRSMGDLT